jgi:hypothetical protein
MLKYAPILLVLVAGTVSAHDWQSVWISPVTRMDLKSLESEGFMVEGFFDGRARLYVDSGEMEMLRHLGYSPVPESRPEPLVPYPTITELYASIDAVVAAHPDICRLEIIGTSVQGREIRAVVVSDNVGIEEIEPELRIQGAIHGDEKTAAMVSLNYLQTLTDNYGTSPMCTYVVDTAESWIIPVLNPDGYVLDQRYNAHGIDLNRNLSYMGPGGGGGSTAFSEPETQALRDITMQNWPDIADFINPFVTGLSMHGGAQCFNTPWNYTADPLPEDYDLMDAQSQAYANSPGIVSYFGPGSFVIYLPGAIWYVTNGDVNDWSLGEVGTVDHTIEVHNNKQASDWPGVSEAHYMAILEFMQNSTYGIWGTVTDQWGNPLDGLLQIGIADGADSTPLRFCRTDVTLGDYAKTLVPGTYDVMCTVPGYSPQTVLGVDAGPGERVEVSFVFYTNGTGETSAGVSVPLLGVSPNPVRSSCVFTLPLSGVEGRLAIYDILGRLVYGREVPAGTQVLHWDGSSQDGGRLPAGVYTAMYSAGRDQVPVRLVIGV